MTQTDVAAAEDTTTRALILAGGGLKVAFQAGVLQVWLDEAGLDFDLADGTSGGTFNLAMYCQGMTGTQIANNWRSFSPRTGIAVNWPGILLGPLAPSVFTFDKYRNVVFPAWDIDADQLPETTVPARFNVFNFSDRVLESKTPQEMNEDLLVACNSLPFWFPPVKTEDTDGDTYLDAVYVTDANIEQAIADGATEIYVIWTVSKRGVWRNGFVAQYFQTIEESANGTFQRIQDRINLSNAAIDAELPGEFAEHIDLKILSAEVPLHYIMNLRRDRIAAAVELGVREARKWCDDNGIARTPPGLPPPDPISPDLTFKEKMTGAVLIGGPPVTPPTGPYNPMGLPLTLKLKVHIGDIERFVTDPEHCAPLTGTVQSAAFGGTCEITGARLNLLTFIDDPGNARMHYVVKFEDPSGIQRTLIGDKFVVDDPGWDMWNDTTTMYFDVWPGYLDEPDGAAEPIGSGQVQISPLGFLRQQMSMRPQAESLCGKASVMTRFYAFFLGRLFDVYGQKILPWSPF